MKICVINPGLRHGRIRTEALAKHFSEVHLFEDPPTEGCTISSIPNLFIHTDLARNSFCRGIKLKQRIASIKPHGIVCHFASDCSYFDQIYFHKYPVAVIAMGHDILHEWSDHSVSSIYSSLVKSALGQTDFICAKSDFIHKRIKSWGSGGVLRTNYWGINRKNFYPGDKTAARKKLGLPLAGPLLLSPRAIIRRCNIDVVVEAYAIIAKSFPQSRLLLLGRTDKDCLTSIRQSIDRLGIGKQTHLLGDVSQSEITEYYRASDAVVSLASSEGFPTTVFEAMACEVPVIAGKIPQTEELLVNFENALLTDIESRSVAAAMQHLFESPELVSRVVDAGKRMVVNYGDLDKNAEDFARQFKTVITDWHKAEKLHGMMKFKLLYSPLFLLRQFSKGGR